MHRVVIAGDQATFPNRCSCCGDSAQTGIAVSETVSGGGTRTTSTWEIPYCTACAEHVKSLRTGMGIALLYLFSLGLFYIQWRLIWRPRREKRARAMCKTGCADIYGVRYQFDRGGNRHLFEFPSEAYARDFARANQAVLVNPESVRALLE